jgi:hypothetical protein
VAQTVQLDFPERESMKLFINRILSKRGQTMMEYIILVALLAVASIPVAKILGDVFRDRVLRSADEIAGGGNYASEGDRMVQEGKGKVKRSMKDF